MNGLHDLLEKLKKLEEVAASAAPAPAPAAVDPDEAKYAAYQQKIEAQKAQAGLVAKLQGMLLKRDDPNTKSKGYFIDPTNGLIGWASPYGNAPERPDLLRFDQADTGVHKAVKQLLANAGIKMVPSQNIPGILNYSGGYASVPMDQVKLIQSGKLPNQAQPAAPVAAAPVAAAQAAAPVAADKDISAQAQNGALSNQFPVSPAPAASASVSAVPGTMPPEIKANLTRVKQIISGMKEGIRFKSRIGHALLESFDLKLNEDATADLAELNKIWPSCVKWAEANPSTAEAKEIEGLRGQVTKWQASVQSGTVGKAPAPLKIPGVDTVAQIAAQVAAVPGAASADGTEVLPAALGPVPTPAAAEKKKETVLPQAVTDLAAANKIIDANKISVGQVITLPDGKTKYTIVAGDTLSDIAAGKFKGVDPTKTAEYNPAKDSQLANASLGNGDAAKAQLDPRGKPLVKDKDGNLGYFNNPNVPSKGFTIVVPAAGDAAKEARKPRYDTVEKFDKEIARFSSKYDMKLKLNQQYIANLEAEKAQLATATVKPASTTGDITSSDRPGLDPKKGKPEVYDRQKQLAALGAKMKDGVTPLGLDGVNGNDTIAAEKEFGRLIVDPKTTIVVNGAPRVVNANDIKSIQSWIKAVKEKRKKMEEVPPVYMDIVKKQSAIKESTGYTNDELSRLISLVHHR